MRHAFETCERAFNDFVAAPDEMLLDGLGPTKGYVSLDVSCSDDIVMPVSKQLLMPHRKYHERAIVWRDRQFATKEPILIQYYVISSDSKPHDFVAR